MTLTRSLVFAFSEIIKPFERWEGGGPASCGCRLCVPSTDGMVPLGAWPDRCRGRGLGAWFVGGSYCAALGSAGGEIAEWGVLGI